MIKAVTLLKRRKGMSKSDFIDHYERHHRLIGERVLAGYATHYCRRFLEPADGIEEDQDFDVIMEIWFPDEQAQTACFARLKEPAIRAEILADENRLFDLGRIRRFFVSCERQSTMPPIRAD